MGIGLFHKFASVIRSLPDAAIADPQHVDALRIGGLRCGQKEIEMIYAPFDHVNNRAQLAIVGITPGRQQASNALRSARDALRRGASLESAAAEAKVYASFSGPMRSNLVRLLDHIGAAGLFGLQSTSDLWAERSELAHFTSALRYPVFVNGENYSGQPNMISTPGMRSWLEEFAGQELARLKDAMIVPLGPKVAAAMEHLAQSGLLDRKRILSGIPHPSGANAERIACFLGDKPPHLVSPKTNAASLIRCRESLISQVQSFS